MMTINIIYALMLVHVLADQVLQLPIVKKGKDEHVLLMAAHTTTWAFWMIPVCIWMMLRMTHDWSPMVWWIIMSTAHFVIDYPISFWINELIKKKKFHHAISVVLLNHLFFMILMIKMFFVIVIWN